MPLSLKFALRELRGGLAGLRLLGLCLLLGVAALAGVGSLSSAIITGLSSRGQELLGGDVEIRITQRAATPDERAVFAGFGQLSETARMRAMVGRSGSDERLLGELKAVDGHYPLYGRFVIEGGTPLQPALQGRSAVIGRALADQLDLRPGDFVDVGNARLRVAGIIAQEPDRAGEGFTMGPTVLVNFDTLAATGLVQPGSLIRYHYRLKLAPEVPPEQVTEAIKARFPESGWRIEDRSNGAPGVRRFVERLGQFLTLVGLTALVVAGVGVGNGVGSYLDAKTGTIATFKSLGASSALIFRTYLLQIGLVSLGAVLAGLLIGALVPLLVVWIAGDALPVPPVLGLYPAPLLVAALYGLLIALAFALWPLARARAMPAARLFRSGVEAGSWPSAPILMVIGAAALLIAALAIGLSREKLFAAGFVGAAIALLAVLALLSALIRALARRLPRPRNALSRLAVANLHRPGALTRQLIVALGLGLTLFATLSVIETNFAAQVERTLPDRAPTYFFLDLPTDGIGEFRAIVDRTAPGAALRIVPSLRGPVTAVNGVPVSQMKSIPDGAWFLRGDRGLTYSATVPEGNSVVAGRWWPANYSGPPLVSIDVEAANALGLKVGDKLTVSVLGVEIEATIANMRSVDWDTLGFNFVLVFAPGTLEHAPHSYMATAAVDEGQERALYRAATRAFPTASVIRVKDILATVEGLMGQMSIAVRAAASVTIAAGIAVLVGALAASRRARIYDAVLLKVLGATRGQVLKALLLEYGLLAAIVSLLALVLGTFSGWYVVTQVLELEWQPRWPPVVATVLIGAAVTILLGLAGSWAALSARPNRVLRTL